MRRALLVLLLLANSCNGGGDSQVSDTRILVTGNDMGPRFQNVSLTRLTSPVSNAQVSVNGVALTETVPGQYSGQLPVFLADGSQIRVTVVSGSDTIVGNATVPSAPNLVAPTNGTAVHYPTPLDFVWTVSPDPDAFRAAIQYDGGAEIGGFPGTARSGIVVSSRLPHPTATLSAFLYSYNDGTFSGPARPDSRMRVRQTSGTVSLVLVQ